MAALVSAARALDLDLQHNAGSQETAMDIHARNREALAAVQERRDEYYEAILGLERAMAEAAGDDAAGWASRAGNAALEMRSVLRHHITETEAVGGFYDDIAENYPNLANAASKLRSDHAPLRAGVDQLVETLSTVRDDVGVENARVEALDLLRGLLLHRHRGAELVYDAFNVDVATGD
ncbi:MAG: hypothetical protein ACKOA9_01380 [Actinomycetota bacterium]